MITSSVNFTMHDFRVKTKTAQNYTMTGHHFHNEYEIYYLNEGSRKYFINDSTYMINEGDLVLIKPNDIHKTMDTGTGHSRVLMSFKPEFLPFKDRDAIIKTCFNTSSVLSFDPVTRQHIEGILKDIIRTAKDQKTYYLTALQCLLIQFLMETSTYLMNNASQYTPKDKNSQKIFDIIVYLRDNSGSAISLEDLANRFYMSKFHLSRTFKKATGLTVFEYLQSIRVLKAQQLLVESKTTVTEIALKSGFSTLSGFGKTFKSVTGMSPAAYRKMNRKL